MSAERVIIKPRNDRLKRFSGALLLGMVGLFFALLAWAMTLSPLRFKAGEAPQILFFGTMVLGMMLYAAWMGARMALETQIWVAGRDYFECQSRIFFFNWRKIYRASSWRIESQTHRGRVFYTLSPVGARIGGSVLPFYTTPGVLNALKLGRQLALATGWPLRLSAEIRRIEQELEKELQT